MTDYKIIDDALNENDFKNIEENILNSNFPWSLTPKITDDEEDLPIHGSFYFTHTFWQGFDIEVNKSQIFIPLLNLMDCNALIRIKANCYPSTPETIIHKSHTDYDFSHKGAIFYLNTNNGVTILEDKVEIKSIKNRLLLFDSSKPHRSTTCTDEKCRINVNFNYF
tara:strand:- start:667 stop:1164 length:498 start_codon:yes stop_codon:yes gene_type:complete